MKKVIFAVLAVLVAASSAGAFWYGNQPKITRYPSGEVKTSVEQKFFKENGEYKAFNEDGTLAQKYTVVDGLKVGQGFVYAGGVTTEVNFADGKLQGPLKFDTKGKVTELDNLQINIDNGVFTVKFAEEKKEQTAPEVNEDLSNADVIFKGHIVCDETEFLNNMQAFLTEQNLNTYTDFAKCVSLTESIAEDDLYKCEFRGAYQYPKFTEESKFECNAKGVGDEILKTAFMSYGITEMGKLRSFTTYSPNDRTFSFNVVDDKGVYNQTQSFRGLEEIIQSVTEYALSKQDSKDTVKLISDILKSFSVTDSQLSINGKVVSAVKGEFNFMSGFSNPWTASFFGVENTITSQLKITDKGILMNVAYPISKKPLLSVGIQIDETFKDKYKSVLDLVLKEFSENTEEVAAEHLLSKLPEYSMVFSDVIKSINALLMSNKGEKVLGAVFNVKKGVDFMAAAENPASAFTAKIISYKNNKPNKVFAGDVQNGFVSEGKVIAFEDIPNYLDKDTLTEISKQVESEYNEVYKMMKANNYSSDPFIRGFYEGYFNAMQTYKASEVTDQIEKIAGNIRAVYADSESFGNLNNTMALNLKAIPDEMITPDGNIVNALGGKVDIYAAPAFEGDDEKSAFILRVSGISQEACNAVATAEWTDDDGMMALGINKDIDNVYLDEVESKESQHCAEGGILCVSEHKMNELEAGLACHKDDNVLFFKFQ